MAISHMGAQPKRAFTIADLYRVQSVSGLNLSPDGKTLAFAVTKKDLKAHKSATAIQIMNLAAKGAPAFNPMTLSCFNDSFPHSMQAGFWKTKKAFV